MTRPSHGQTAVDSTRLRALAAHEGIDNVIPLLHALSNEGCAEVLRLLSAGISDPAEIARKIEMPLADVRRHIRSLAEAGLDAETRPLTKDDFGAIYHALRLMNTTIHGRDGIQSQGHTRIEPVTPQTPTVPQPPYACTVCDNSGFVFGVLDDLRAASRQLREYHRRIQEMSSQILTAHEAERLRIARELHDDTAQAITSMLVRLRLLERSSDAEEVLRNVEELRELTSDALDSVRRLAMDLRPAALDDLGLVPALQSFTERHASDWNLDIPVTVKGIKRRLPRDIELVLYRVLQEALTNVAKHAKAHQAKVALTRQRNEVTLTVADDGKGLRSHRPVTSGDSGLGLFGMRERLALVGGELQVESRPGEGTTIIARVPLPAGRRQRRKK